MKADSIIIYIVSLLFLAGCSNAQQEGKIIAEVNGSKLTYEFLLNQFPPEYHSTITDEQLSRTIEAWIETELLYQEALKHGIDKDKRVQNLIEQKRKDLIAAKFVDISISGAIDVADEEIDSVYQNNKEMFTANEELLDLSHIVLASKTAAEAVYKRLKRGDDFSTLALDYSEDKQSRDKSGRLGLLPVSAVEKDMADAISRIEVGQFTAPIESQTGFYHIFLLEGRQPSGATLPLADIREEIAESIIAEKQQMSYKELLNRLTENAEIKRFPLDEDDK